MNKPKVTALIPVYNGELYIKESIESVLNQTYENIELIVIDDGSTDSTNEIVNSIKSRRLKYIKQENGGCSSAYNSGLSAATGEYVAIHNHDDIWHPEKLRKQIELIEKNDADISFTDYYKFRGAVPEFSDIKSKTPAKMISRRNYTDTLYQLLMGNIIPAASFLAKRECFENVGLFDCSLPNAEDYDMWTRMAVRGYRFSYVNEPLTLIRMHDSNKSSNYSRAFQSRMTIIDKIYDLSDFPAEYSKYKDKSLARAYGSCAMSFYKGGEFKEYRQMCNQLFKKDISALNLKLFRRYIKSFFKREKIIASDR